MAAWAMPAVLVPHEDFRLGIMGFNQFRQAVLHIQTDLMIREGQAVVTINGTF